MKINNDRQKIEPLLDATLRDDSWQAADDAFKAEALRAFRTGQRVRRFRRWTGAIAVLGVVVAAATQWLHRPAVGPRQAAVISSPPPEPVREATGRPRSLSDQQLVAAFPKGSCFIAEIDGRKQVVFLKPELARVYMPMPRVE